MRINFIRLKYCCLFLLVLLFGLSFNSVYAQTERKISGNLLDNTNQPISGASVSVQGTSKVTSTGTDGSFSISAKTGDKILFSYLGYQTKELTRGHTIYL